MPTAIVTGAGHRIGAQIAIYLAQQGYDILLQYNNFQEAAEKTAEKIEKIGRKVSLIKANFFKNNEIDKLVEIGKFANLLINNAAIFENDSALGDTDLILKEHLMVNTVAAIELSTKLGKKNSEKRINFDIINILDYTVFTVQKNFFSYNFTKKIMYNWTQLAAKQMAPYIRVNGIALGNIMKNDKQSIENFKKDCKNTPLRCTGTIEELFPVMQLFINVRSITGQIVAIDGGMHLI